MKWLKRGKIFDPRDFNLTNGCVEFAQSPQALVFDNFVRVYFSTRVLESTGQKYLSHVAFADFDKAFRTVLQVAEKPVIPLGGLGCFDEHGIFPFSPLRHRNEVLAYTCGWNRRVSVSVDTAIGLAISRDNGLTFEKCGTGPILGPSLHEPFLVGDPFVRYQHGQFHMWYIFGTAWRKYAPEAPPDRTYKIGYATSPDGLAWTTGAGRQIIADRLPSDESQALPSVIHWGGRYHMVFCFRESFDFRKNPGRGYQLGYAFSDDLRSWHRDDSQIDIGGQANDWDDDMQCYPHLFECDGHMCLLYNGNAFGRHGFGLAVLE